MKYNREDGSICLSAFKPDGGVTLAISDTGIGIPVKDLEYIFEPFYRVDSSRSRSMGGSGLGLSLVQDIIERHGGTIQVESDLGMRTIFTKRFH